MAKYIRNISEATKVYQGREILAGDFFLITANLEAKYSQDTSVLLDLASSIIKMSPNGVDNLSGSPSDHIDFLKGNLAANVTVSSAPSFTSKTIKLTDGTIKKLFARNAGVQYDVITGSNTLTYTIGQPWVKMLGAEIVNCEALDTVDFKVYDNAAGSYSGVPNLMLNQFSFALNLPKDFYQRSSQFDADVYQGMVLQITYVSKSDKKVGINFLLNEVKT